MDTPCFPNPAFKTIAVFIQSPLEDEIADDLSGEQDTLQGSVAGHSDAHGLDEDGVVDDMGAKDSNNVDDVNDIAEYQSRILAVSKAVTERTAKEYKMYVWS